MELAINIALFAAILGASWSLTNWFARRMYIVCRACGTLNARRRAMCRVCGKALGCAALVLL